jgi:hypothetical protein
MLYQLAKEKKTSLRFDKAQLGTFEKSAIPLI